MPESAPGRLEGRVALITGAGRGIGYAYATRFLEEGATVVVAELDAGMGEDAAARLSKLGPTHFVATDVADPESARRAADAATEQFGRIDILLNNAGLYGDMDGTDQSVEYLRKMFDINTHGSWLMASAVAPQMVKQGAGRIVNVASIAAYNFLGPTPEQFKGLPSFNYRLSKWGVVGLTKHLAGYLKTWGITVNCISPGYTFSSSTIKKVAADKLAGMSKKQEPFGGRIEPEDMTGAAVFFASDDARFVTGQCLVVDGGEIIV